MGEKIQFGIGFITGRKNVCEIINYTYKFLLGQIKKEQKKIEITIFLLFDMGFQSEMRTEFYKLIPNVYKDIEVKYITPEDIEEEKKKLIGKRILKEEEANLFLGYGYGKARNTLMYMAAKSKMDYFLFWDDDEYPVYCFKNKENNLEWKLQNNILQHIKYIQDADVTLGRRCGYTSPIPYIDLNEIKDEDAVKGFIEAIKNEFTTWEQVKEYWTASEGVTYANKKVVNDEVCNQKGKPGDEDFFIAGSPLCLNLQNIDKIPAFYNPEGARGEDVFFTLALKDTKVLQIPVYHFHDSFLKYTDILKKEYPKQIETVKITDDGVAKRFINASKGWIKYRPLYLYITDKKNYRKEIELTKENLKKGIPEMNRIFGTKEFDCLIEELDKYDQTVQKDYEQYVAVNKIWQKIKKYHAFNNKCLASKRAYVTVLSTENYIEGVLTLDRALKKVSSKYPLYVLLSNNISAETEKMLRKFNIPTIRKPEVSIPEEIINRNVSTEKGRWNYTFEKLNIFELTEFEKIVFLDSDLFITKNIDELFEKPHMSAVIDKHYGPNITNRWMELTSGVMVIEPEANQIEVFKDIIKTNLSDRESIGDQDILQKYDLEWKNKAELHLKNKYNVFFPYIEYYVNMQEQSLEDFSVIHFIYPQKPWAFTSKNRIEEYVQYVNDFTQKDYEKLKIEDIKDALCGNSSNLKRIVGEYYKLLDEIKGKK